MLGKIGLGGGVAGTATPAHFQSFAGGPAAAGHVPAVPAPIRLGGYLSCPFRCPESSASVQKVLCEKFHL